MIDLKANRRPYAQPESRGMYPDVRPPEPPPVPQPHPPIPLPSPPNPPAGDAPGPLVADLIHNCLSS